MNTPSEQSRFTLQATPAQNHENIMASLVCHGGKDLDMVQDQSTLQTHTLRQYSSAQPMGGQQADDARAIFHALGHFGYRDAPSLGPGRRYVTYSGKQILCEGSGPNTVCRWA